MSNMYLIKGTYRIEHNYDTVDHEEIVVCTSIPHGLHALQRVLQDRLWTEPEITVTVYEADFEESVLTPHAEVYQECYKLNEGEWTYDYR